MQGVASTGDERGSQHRRQCQRLLSDSGPAYLFDELRTCLTRVGAGAPAAAALLKRAQLMRDCPSFRHLNQILWRRAGPRKCTPGGSLEGAIWLTARSWLWAARATRASRSW